MSRRVVLVTGVSRFLGARLLQLLQADPDVDHVVGVDVVAPPPDLDLGDAELVRADIRNPGIAKVLARADVDTVVHMGVLATGTGRGRTTVKEINVIGTMQLLAACQRSPQVSRLVVKSTTAVYGASGSDPAMFGEDDEPVTAPRGGFARDSLEVEGYVRGFARRRPDVAVTTLRLANILGPHMDTPLAAYLSLPVVPTVLGYDGRFQLVHEHDALQALWRSVGTTYSGAVNVAGDGVLTVSQAARRAGRPTLPVPFPALPWLGPTLRRAKVADFSPDQVGFLAHGRVVDTARIREVLGFQPRWSTAATLDDFVRHRSGMGLVSPRRVGGLEARARAAMTEAGMAVRGG